MIARYMGTVEQNDGNTPHKKEKPQTYRAFAVCSHSAHKDERGIPFVWENLSIPISIPPPTDSGIEVVATNLSYAAHSAACPECPLQPKVTLIVFTGGDNS